jgi:hypothetical protein
MQRRRREVLRASQKSPTPARKLNMGRANRLGRFFRLFARNVA